MTNQNNNAPTINKVLIGAVILELIVIIILAVMLNNKTNENEQLTQKVEIKSSEVEDKTKELESISADLERVKSEREKLGLNNDSLSVQINQLNNYIVELRKTNKLDAGKRKELEAMVAKLRKQVIDQEQQIATLKTENDSLTTNVSRLTTEKTKLGDSLTSVATKQKEVESKLAYASILKAENVKVTVLKSNGKEIDDDENEFKASKIDRLKLTFTLADNKAARQDSKDFYIRLKTPDGTVFSDPNNGGGYFNTSDGTPLSFSQKQ